MPQTAKDDAIKEVTTLFTTEIHFRCPYCDEVQEGWVGDPSGKDHKCEECGNTYRVNPEADIEYGYSY